MFERVSECLKNDFDFDDDTKECIVSHLKSLQSEIERYFPDIYDGHIVAQSLFSPGNNVNYIRQADQSRASLRDSPTPSPNPNPLPPPLPNTLRPHYSAKSHKNVIRCN